MKTNRQSFESATASKSNDLFELDDFSLSQIAGGAGPSEEITFSYGELKVSYKQQ